MTTTQVKDNVMFMTLTNLNVKKAIKTYNLSKKYINTMMRTTIINILYHRLNIDNKEFLTKHFEDIPFKSFKPKSKNAFIREFHTYMIACRDAVEKNYLKEFYLFFIDVSTGDIIENYKFSFRYGSKKEPHGEQDPEVLIENTCDLLRTLEELGQHQKFTGDVQVKVEFTYYDDTPEEYEPPGFRSVDESECLVKKIDNRGNSVVIGTLFTGYHLMKCRGKGKIFNFNMSPTPTSTVVNEDPANDEIEAIELMDSDDFAANNVETVPERTLLRVNTDLFTEDISEKDDEAFVGGQDSDRRQLDCTFLSNYSNDELIFFENCPCKNSEMSSVPIDDIKCEECGRVFHAPCMGYLDKTFLKGPYKCNTCSAEINSETTAFSDRTQSSVALFRLRLIIGAIYVFGKCPPELRKAFPETLANLKETSLFTLKGDEIKHVKLGVLANLFKFEYQGPDLTKFKTI